MPDRCWCSLANGSDNKTIIIWDIKSGNKLTTLIGHTDWVWSLVVLPNGLLASGSYDSTIKRWDIKSGNEIITLSGHTWLYVNCLVVLPDGSVVKYIKRNWSDLVKNRNK